MYFMFSFLLGYLCAMFTIMVAITLADDDGKYIFNFFRKLFYAFANRSYPKE